MNTGSNDEIIQNWANKFINKQLSVPGRFWSMPAARAKKLYRCKITTYDHTSRGLSFMFAREDKVDREYMVCT